MQALAQIPYDDQISLGVCFGSGNLVFFEYILNE
jgi:hypothetical protein